jgi:hypothetical protein
MRMFRVPILALNIEKGFSVGSLVQAGAQAERSSMRFSINFRITSQYHRKGKD